MRLPWIRRTGIREAEIEDPAEPPEIFNRGDASGIGDMTFSGQYRFYNDRATRTEAAVLLGVKAPTGVTDRINNQASRSMRSSSQARGRGTGCSASPTPCGSANGRSTPTRSTCSSPTACRTPTSATASLYNAGHLLPPDARGLRHGAHEAGALPDPMWHGGPGAHQHSREASGSTFGTGPRPGARTQLANGTPKEVQSGVRDPNSGGNTVYIAPGLRLSKDNWSSFVSVGIPIINDLNGISV